MKFEDLVEIIKEQKTASGADKNAVAKATAHYSAVNVAAAQDIISKRK